MTKITLRTAEGKSETVSAGDVTVGGSKAVGFVSTAARARSTPGRSSFSYFRRIGARCDRGL